MVAALRDANAAQLVVDSEDMARMATFYVPPVDPPATWPTNYVGRGVPPYTPTEEQPTRIGGEET